MRNNHAAPPKCILNTSPGKIQHDIPCAQISAHNGTLRNRAPSLLRTALFSSLRGQSYPGRPRPEPHRIVSISYVNPLCAGSDYFGTRNESDNKSFECCRRYAEKEPWKVPLYDARTVCTGMVVSTASAP